jgi:hypothetical protein
VGDGGIIVGNSVLISGFCEKHTFTKTNNDITKLYFLIIII